MFHHITYIRNKNISDMIFDLRLDTFNTIMIRLVLRPYSCETSVNYLKLIPQMKHRFITKIISDNIFK